MPSISVRWVDNVAGDFGHPARRTTGRGWWARGVYCCSLLSLGGFVPGCIPQEPGTFATSSPKFANSEFSTIDWEFIGDAGALDLKPSALGIPGVATVVLDEDFAGGELDFVVIHSEGDNEIVRAKLTYELSPEAPDENRLPTVVVNEAATIVLGESLTLSAADSFDEESGPSLVYSWRPAEIEQGEHVSISDLSVIASIDGAFLTLTPCKIGSHYIEVRVSDGANTVPQIIQVDVIEGENAELPASCNRLAPRDPYSDFSEGDEGWTVVNNDLERPSWYPERGRSNGFLAIKDQGDAVWYWRAPASFLGCASDAFGQSLTYDISPTHSDRVVGQPNVKLFGAGKVLVYYANYSPMAGWTHYHVPLMEGPGWFNELTEESATTDELQSVLANMTGLWILGEYSGNNDETGLDNVRLNLGDGGSPRVESVFSRFDDSDHDWRIIGNGSIGSSIPIWEEDGGRSGGFVHATDATDSTWYWDAPTTFLGDISAAMGRNFKFDAASIGNGSMLDRPDVIMRGSDISLYFEFSYEPMAGWTHFHVDFDVRSGWRVVGTDERATNEEIQRVLRTLGQLLIRGEYLRNADTGSLDNVQLDINTVIPAKTTTVVSTFDRDGNEWSVVGNGALGASRPIWEAEGGRSDGFILNEDNHEATWYWNTPASYLGNVECAYGKSLEFDLGQINGGSNFEAADVLLRGGGKTLAFDAIYSSFDGWTHYHIPIRDSVGWIDVATGEQASEEEIRIVLSDLSQLLIRGEYRRNTDTGSIDNVVLRLCEPGRRVVTGTVTSQFETSTEGWLVIGNGQVGASRPEFVQGSADTTGFIQQRDRFDETWYWLAPDAYLGDASTYYGGTLSFELRQDSRGASFEEPDVILRGGGVRLGMEFDVYPESGWTSYTVALNDGFVWMDLDTDEFATESQLRRVLASLGQIMIRGEFARNDDVGGIDNVVFRP